MYFFKEQIREMLHYLFLNIMLLTQHKYLYLIHSIQFSQIYHPLN